MQRLTHSTQQPFASRFYVVLSSANHLTAMQHSQLVIFWSHKKRPVCYKWCNIIPQFCDFLMQRAKTARLAQELGYAAGGSSKANEARHTFNKTTSLILP